MKNFWDWPNVAHKQQDKHAAQAIYVWKLLYFLWKSVYLYELGYALTHAFTKIDQGAREKNEGNLILVLMFLDHFKHLETTQIISRSLSLIVCAILRVINNAPKILPWN